MACTNCGGTFSGCTTQCTNPCSVDQSNTPACESLPSQIQNFTTQFFGEVIKTEVNGEVVWSLPCSLETGLPNNPRAVDEGLACYFLRLFRDGIGGLTGPQGVAGTPGTDGANSYSVTIQSFGQPTLNAPLTQIVIVPNPVFVEGIGIFVQHSGYYTITNVAPGGVLFVTLISPLPAAPAVIPSGSFVIPAGVGAQGPAGPQGPTGNAFTSSNGTTSAVPTTGGVLPGSVQYTLTGVYAVIDYTSMKLEFSPPAAGTYLVTGVISFTGQAAVNAADIIRVQLRTSDGDVYQQSTSYANGLANGVYYNLPISAIIAVTGTPGQTVQAFATTNGAALSVSVEMQGTYLTWLRIA